MKRLFYLIVILPLLATWSCVHHYDCCTVAQPPAKVTAEKNGAAWTPAFAQGTLSSADSLSISATSATYLTTTGQSAIYNKIDSLNIKIAYTGPGTYALTGNQAFYGTFNNGTLTGYKMDDTYNSVIVITGYQRLNNPYTTVPDEAEITGTFNIMFVDPNSPSGISFKNGSFYALVPYL